PQRAAVQLGFLNYPVFCKYYIHLFGEHPKATHIATNRKNTHEIIHLPDACLILPLGFATLTGS
ncbi:KH domain-containing protein, partial [Pseudomonas syringae group genomosp. 7]|uniref:hypothetical protein n=1 Tax=Pseudomonas syringae group genomosp. 7 TaxID=251699 RepID=UPI00376F4CCF